MKTRTIILSSLIAATLLGTIATVFAAGPTATIPPVSNYCTGTLVLNLNYHAINDLDSGFTANWALDHYAKNIQVYQTGTNTYCAFLTYDGGWQTFAGAYSPASGYLGAPVTTESRDAAGNMNGFLVIDFTATSTNINSVNAILSTQNYGGTAADITSHGSGAPPAVFDWMGTYFGSTCSNGACITSEPDWAFYYYQGNKLGWTNAASGSLGNVLV